MPTVREIFLEFGPKYLDKFGDNMPGNHRNVIEAIMDCRTSTYGFTVYECEDCKEIHRVFRCCGNRHCPNCQHQKTMDWVNRQIQRQVPGHHFMVTFTVPEQLRNFMRSNQKVSYSALFKSASETIFELTPDRHIGGDKPGFMAILHTWTRLGMHHPHIHCIVPGGAMSSRDGQWHPSQEKFFLPVQVMSRIFREKFKEIMKKEKLMDQIPPEVWFMDWNVNSQAVGSGESTIKYLSFYVFKVWISDHRIVSVENGLVTFSYRKKGCRRMRKCTVTGEEFIRRFLQHVLPKGFMKVRYYGFMNANSSIKIEEVRGLIELSRGFEIESPDVENIIAPPKPLYCKTCGGSLRYVYSVLPYQMTEERIFWDLLPDKPPEMLKDTG